MKAFHPGHLFIPLALLARLAAEPLPPPTTGGTVDIEANAAAESYSGSWQYQPPKPYVILAETVFRSVGPHSVRTPVPAAAGSVTRTFVFDSGYAANHPEVVRPIRGVDVLLGSNSVVRFDRITLHTTWSDQGVPTFSLSAQADSLGFLIEGSGVGEIIHHGAGPGSIPFPWFLAEEVTNTEGKVGWFYWGDGLTRRHLPGIQHYWTEAQPDGSIAVFHDRYYTEPVPGLGEFYPIGELVSAGTPGRATGYTITTEPLTESAAAAALQAEGWTFAGNYQPQTDPSAHYFFSPTGATASRLRYKLQIQPGLARAIIWAETFTPDGPGEPADYRFVSEDVPADAAETTVHEIDPFARFGAQAGVYRILAFESDSFDATLTADVNRDGSLVPAGGPLTGYVIANADAATSAQPYALLFNSDDDDGDGAVDGADGMVNGANDVADFAPVFLNIKSLLAAFPPGSGAVYKLSQADAAVNFVYTDLTRANAFSYRDDDRDYGYGPDFDQPVASATVQPVTAAGMELAEDFLHRIRDENQGVILIEARSASSAPLVLTVETATGTAVVRLPLQAFGATLAVDANRDGAIALDTSDATSEAAPYRFWINDDDDDGDDKRSSADDIPLLEGDSNRDSANNTVDGIRDLEDFFPVFLDLKQLLTVLPPGTDGVSYYLKQEDDAVGVVFTSYTRAQAFDYLRGTPADLNTGFGPALTQMAGDAAVVKVTAAGVDISSAGQPTASPAFFDRIKNNDGGVLLVEASKATTKPLVLEVRKGSTVVAELKLELKIDPVETMFRYVNLRSFAHGTPVASNNQGPGYGSTTPTAAPNDPFATVANRKNMVFVHGYNVNGKAARGSAATAFKRFYWSGSKAKFYAVLWRGDDGQGAGIAPAGATPDYHRNVGHAWQQGPLFRDFLGTLQGDTAIMAHSLGNVVTQVALTRARDPNNAARLVPASRPTTVKHYFAVDAAVPLEAVNGTAITSASKDLMRHSSWDGYDERLWPTHWHELFASSDARSTFTWQNVFAGLDVGTNFYSSGEEVLANPEDDSTPFWEPLFFGGLRAWVAQEKIKGGNSVSAVFFRSETAGWTFNTAWYKETFPPDPAFPPRRRTPSEARDEAYPAGVPTSGLPEEPFFKRFQAGETNGFYPGYQGSRLMAPLGDANADDEARKLVTFAKGLGEGIPALSFAQGRNESSRFTGQSMGGNLDLNTDYNPADHTGFKNGWPASRNDTDWKHSDCLDVACTFNFPLYDKMTTDGGLK